MEIKNLSLEEKIAQLFVVGVRQKDKNQITQLINEKKVGGVILYRGCYNNYKEMVSLINEIKKANSKNNIPIFITIDQEGGRVNRMPGDVLNLQSAYKIAQMKDKNLAKESGKIIGKMLYKTGISMNYGPVLDIKRFEEDHAIGDRCYGKTKEEVENYAIDVMKEMQEQNVISVIKHFPGHGLTKKDSHFQIPKITEKIEAIEKEDMAVFKTAIDNGADAIMVGHIMIKDVDKRYPASLSKKIIKNYLIDQYNFKGLIITDDFKMLAIRIHYNINRAVVKAIDAGNDIIMLGVSYNKIEKIIKYVARQVKRGKLSEKRIDESLEKIIKFKEKYKLTDDKVEGFNLEEMNNTIKNFKEKITV